MFGRERRVVVTHSENLHDKQSGASTRHLAKARASWPGSRPAWARGKTPQVRDKVEAEIAAILKPRWVVRVLSATLSGEAPAELRLVSP